VVSGELVTVVFVDVERSTELLVDVGDASGIAAVDAVLDVAREHVTAYGGREVKSLGDGLMLVFPAPRQAVTFAVAVQRGLLGRTPAVRVGINTGEVVASSQDPVGEAVNAAARIAAKAAGGEVLISDVVRQLVGTVPGVRFVDRGRSRLKGFPDRWRLFAATGAEAGVEPAPVFGRDAELDAVDRLLDGLSRGSGSTLVLEGEAGIGKTHLAAAAAMRAASAGVRVVRSGADELDHDRPGRITMALAEDVGVSLQALLGDVERLGGTRGFAITEAMTNAIEDLSTKRPVLVVVDDLQWADELSLRGLASFIRRTTPLPVGVIVTMRPSPRPPLLERMLAALPEATTRRLHLHGLHDAAVTAMVATVTGAPPGPRLAALVAGASGNPLYVTELLRALEEDSELHVRGGVAEVDDMTLPATLRHTVLRRLASLPADSVELLRIASLLGRDFSLGDLATVTGRRVVDVAAHLRAAVDAAVLSGEGDMLSFRHDLIRDAVYDDITAPIRRDLHAAAGRSLAAAGAPVLQVARQLSLGARPGDALAVEWLERAGYETMRLDLASAVLLLQQALALAGDSWSGRDRVEAALLEPLASCGRLAEARALGAELLDRGIDSTHEFAVRQGLAVVSTLGGDLTAAATDAMAAADVPGAPPGAAAVMRCLEANISLLTGRPPADVQAAAEQALAAVDGAGGSAADLACVAHQSLASVAGVEGRYEVGADHARIARRLLFRGGITTRGFLIPEVWEATFLLYTDRFDDAIAAYAIASARAERRGELSLLVQTHTAVGMIHLLAGRWDDASSEIEAALAVTRETGNNAHDVACHALLAKLAVARGDAKGAEAALLAGRTALSEGRHLFGVDVLLWVEATVLEHGGDAAGALALLAAVWEQTATLRGLVQYRNVGPPLARLARAQGDVDLSRTVADEMRCIAARTDAPSAVAAALRTHGLAHDDAGALVRAVETYRTSPRRLDLAEACEDAALALLRAGDQSTARRLLDEAALIHIECGATAELARIDSIQRGHGIRHRRRGPAPARQGWEALSPTEGRVVELVTEGLSNPQIGARLFISRRTVETHISHIFRKLDVASRAQLAAFAASHRHGGA
jgi:class 3 adenylate cyclase/DNA-binding CsgD family transcriptional regulator